MARRPFIAGNWKMNPETLDDAVKLAKSIAEASKTATAQVRAVRAPLQGAFLRLMLLMLSTPATHIESPSPEIRSQVAICAPHPYLWSVGNEFKGSNVELGAQVHADH
jgi:triosephosphate isomerase